MILSKTPAKLKQAYALTKARSWRGHFWTVKKAILEAAAAYPLSDIQWHNLQLRFGVHVVKELRALAEKKS